MKTATVTLNLTKEGHHVVREEVTPAELLLLVAEHHHNAGGDPVLNITENAKEVTRTPGEEVARLKMRYAANKVNAAFPGATPNLPSDFKASREAGVKMVLPTSKLTQVDLAK